MATAAEPAWLIRARLRIGMREIKGPKHNATIVSWLKTLKAWWTDDETPWCGALVAICLHESGIDVPKAWYRAKAWGAWGKNCVPALGCVVVCDRAGGGHVGFAVGISPGFVHILGGNQGDAVNIMRMARSRVIGWRWPVDVPAGRPLPQLDLAGAPVSTNEA
jgi:uncharacterized protein (TIGR02594 family)